MLASMALLNPLGGFLLFAGAMAFTFHVKSQFRQLLERMLPGAQAAE